jgi:hypothetical protein
VEAERYFFQVWLPEILALADLVVDEVALRKAWVKGDRSRTSIYYPGELCDVVDDLTDGLENREEIRKRLVKEPALAEALEEFLRWVERFWFATEAAMDTASWGKGDMIADADSVFRSHEWKRLRDHARLTVALAEQAGFNAAIPPPHDC